MSGIMNKILLSKEVSLSTSPNQLNEIFSKMDSKSFRVKKLTARKYKFLARFSLGTLIFGSTPGIVEGIKVYGEIKSTSDTKTTIEFTTELRIELILICFFWFVVILIQIFGNETFPIWVNLLIFPLFLFWFWFIYRKQENELCDNVIRELQNNHRIKSNS